MQPRLSSSKKWTAVPAEYLAQVREIFTQNFKAQLQDGQILTEGRIYPEEILFRVGYLERGRLKQCNFEVSIGFDPKKDNAIKMLGIAVDCAASMMDQFFQAGDDEIFPRQWKSFPFEKREVFLQYSTVNTKLEAEANRILGEASDDLVQGEDPEGELEQAITMLGLKDEDFADEDEEVSSPKNAPSVKKGRKVPKKKLH